MRNLSTHYTYFSGFVACCCLAACTTRPTQPYFYLSSPHDSLCYLHAVGHDEEGIWHDSIAFYGSPVHLESADLTGDGLPEVAVSVVKTTRFSPAPALRLFLFHLYHQRYIRPLWMGSRLGNGLLEFHLSPHHPASVYTHEKDSLGHPLYRQYHLKGFGLKYEKDITYQDFSSCTL